MAYVRNDIRGGAVQSTITAGIGAADTSCAIAASTGWPDGATNGPFYIVIDPGLSTEEKILCATRSSLTVNFTTRGADGSSASAHASGATVYPIVAAANVDEANYTVAQTVGKIAAAGDLLVGSGANALVKVAKGSNSTVFGVDSGGTLGYTTVTHAMITPGTIVNADVNAAAAIATTKLSPDPLARANHTGTQPASTISDFATAVHDNINVSDGTSIDFSYSTGTVSGEIQDAVAGDGLTVSGHILAVGAGVGISVAANAVAVDTAVITTGVPATWTPTWRGTSAAIGNATVAQANYVRVGRQITGWLQISLGSSSVMASTQLAIDLPVAALDPGNVKQQIGMCIFDNNGTFFNGQAYIDFANDTANDRMRLFAIVDGITGYPVLAAVNTTVPFAWSAASTDKMTIHFSYLAAS